MADRVPDDLLAIAEAMLPGTSLSGAAVTEGSHHHVVLLPGVAAIRISRHARAAAALPRRTRLLQLIAAAGVPFAVPEPLTPVTTFDDRAAVAVSWIGGTGRHRDAADPAKLASLLRSLSDVPMTSELRAVLDLPNEDSAGRPWPEFLAEQVIPRLPIRWRDDGRRRLHAALDLPAVAASLVHGDLGSTNVHWGPDGEIAGVLDWDLARAFDPALDAALLSWFGWESVRKAVDSQTYRRAEIWDGLFGSEHFIAVLNGIADQDVDRFVPYLVAWLDNHA
ncbi:MAG TPA: phosphotransferase [Micromonosporaceae bacterium]|nr:phosphotransferase [Micromonosporaceae bacterium]